MTHKHQALDDTIYFWFASNDTDGSGDDGASPAADVRLAGATASDAPILSPTPVLLSNAGYPDGCYEVAVAATTGNGFADTNTYAVFCTLAVDSQNPTGFIGSFTLAPIVANVTQLGSAAQSATDLKDFADAGYDPGTSKVQGVVLTDTTTTNTDMVDEPLDADQINAEIVDVLRTDLLPDSYATDGDQPTIAQALLAIHQFLTEKSVSGTTVTVKKPDGSTGVMTFTLDDAGAPTSITRAS